MLTVKYVCDDHKRYDPSRDGQGGIKGGCARCKEIYELYVALYNLTREQIKRRQSNETKG
jgi:hypothetical protein